MTRENVEVLRAAYESLQARGVEGLLDFATEDVVWISDPGSRAAARTSARRTCGAGSKKL